MKKIKITSLNYTNETEVTDTEYENLKNARNVLIKTLEMESLYDNIIESLLEFKSKINEINLMYLRRLSTNDVIRNHEARSSLNRLVFNILNFSKLYLDKHYFNKNDHSYIFEITGCKDKHKEVVDLYKETYDINKEYALGCALRNFSQHKSLPVDILDHALEPSINNSTLKSVFSIYMPSEYMLDEKKNSTKELINKFDNKIDLNSVIDGYVYAIGKFHIKNRELAEKSIFDSYKRIEEDAQAAKNFFNLNDGHVELIIEKSEKDPTKEIKFTLDLEWFEIVNYLTEKNSYVMNFSKFQFDD